MSSADRGDTIAIMLGSSGSSSNDQTKSKSSEWIPNKLKHWAIYIGGGVAIGLDGDGYIRKEYYGYGGYSIHSKGDSSYADAAIDLYNKYQGEKFFTYVPIVTDCQTFITYVIKQAHKQSTAYSVAGVLTLGVGTSVLSAYAESCGTAAAWIEKGDSTVEKVARFVVATPTAAVLTVAKTPGYLISSFFSMFNK